MTGLALASGLFLGSFGHVAA